MRGVVIYAAAVTCLLILTITYIIWADSRRSRQAGEDSAKLQRSREQIISVRAELGRLREVVSRDEKDIAGVIAKLRSIAKEVEILENITAD